MDLSIQDIETLIQSIDKYPGLAFFIRIVWAKLDQGVWEHYNGNLYFLGLL